jgi:hypothetical protein
MLCGTIPKEKQTMNTHYLSRLSPLHRLGLALGLALGGLSAVASAAGTSETTEVKISSNGQTEVVRIDNLAIGETRQLYSEAGTLVTAHRTEQTLELDIGGDKTSIKMLVPGAGDDLVWIESDDDATASADGRMLRKHVVRLHGAQDGDAHASADGRHKIVMIDDSGAVHELDGLGEDELHIVLKDGDGEGHEKHVVVERKVIVTDSD